MNSFSSRTIGIRSQITEGLWTAEFFLPERAIAMSSILMCTRTVQEDCAPMSMQALSWSPRKAIVLFTSGHGPILESSIEIYHLQGNPHNNELLIVWLSTERILYEADMLNGRLYGALDERPSPALINFRDNIERLHIQPLQIVGAHGNQITTAKDLAFAAGKPPLWASNRPHLVMSRRRMPASA